MDFMQRGRRPTQQVGSTATPNSQTSTAVEPKRQSKVKDSKYLRYFSVALLFSIGILIVALLGFVVLGDKDKTEASYVDTGKYQAVFLNGGQVYFGRIKSLDTKTVRMSDIYYLRVNQQVQPGQQANSDDVSLVKLGCELHGPQDLMLINREQVTFWENLKDDGQVAKAVKQYKDQNPGGQKCENNQAQTPSNGQSSTPAATTTPTPTPATTTPATNKKP